MTAVTQALLLVAVLVSLGLAGYGYRKRPLPEATPFTVFALGTGVWAAGSLGATLVDPVSTSVLWTRFQYLGVVSVPIAFFVLAVRYTGNDEYLTRRRIVALASIGVLIVLAMWTNELHGYYYENVFPDPTKPSGYYVTHGLLFHVWFVIAYTLVLGACGLLARMLYHDQRLYRQQAGATLVAAVAPVASNVAFYLEVTAVDYTPVAFALSGSALGWAMHRFEFMDVTPVARKWIVETIQDGVLVLDVDDRVVDANPAARRLLGVSADPSLIGKRIEDALEPPFDSLLDRLSRADGANAVGDSGESGVSSAVMTFDTERGRRFLDVDVRPYEEASGFHRGQLLFLHDVTDRERRERELERQNEQLDRFASLVSHDLRNPLNVAEGYVSNVKATGNVADLEEVEIAHERMRDIIDDVLDLARTGRTVTDVVAVELTTVAKRAWAAVDTRDATVEIDADTTVLADESRLQQLLENLIRNAVQHGGSDVTVSIGTDDDGFYVADDGPGISPQERDDVLEDGYTTHPDGTGLGLSIVTSVAGAHGWLISLDESEDGGVRFAFTGTTFEREEPPAPAPSK